MMQKNLERIRLLRGKRYYEGLDGAEMEGLKELEEMKFEDDFYEGSVIEVFKDGR